MPYISGGTNQGNSGLAEVKDVYHSGNVYINGVPVALWQDGIASSTAAAISAFITGPQFSTDLAVQEETEGNTDEAAVDARTAELIANGTISQADIIAGSQAGANAANSDAAAGVVRSGTTATTVIADAVVDNTLLYDSPLTGIKYYVKTVTKQPGVVFPYDVATVAPQNGTTVDAVIQNLANLVKNCFDPIKNQYPDAFMTCSFRQKGVGSSTSQHPLGMACDIQYSQASKSEYFTRAQWIRDNVPYDQFLLEYKTTGTKNPWHHISFNSEGNRGQVCTFMNDKNCKGPGVIGLYDLSNI
jgi:hypothetical protein